MSTVELRAAWMSAVDAFDAAVDAWNEEPTDANADAIRSTTAAMNEAFQAYRATR